MRDSRLSLLILAPFNVAKSIRDTDQLLLTGR